MFFARVNPWMGLLHRPTFLNSLEKGLHRTDRGFGGVVLLVCAMGAIHSDNPRHVDDPSIAEGAGIDPPWQSAGWKWASQVDPMRNALSHTPSLYDLQIYAVCVSLRVVSWIAYGLILAPAIAVAGHCSCISDSNGSLCACWNRCAACAVRRGSQTESVRW